MNTIQKRLIDAYVVLVLANMSDAAKGMPIEDVPKTKLIGGVEYPILSEVEIEIANRTIEALG